MQDMKWCFSTNSETFYGDFASRDEVIAAAFEDAGEEKEFVDIGRCKPLDFKGIAKHIVGADAIEDSVYCQISDLVGDCAEDATTRSDLNEIAEQLVPLVEAWLKKHYGTFYEVAETESVRVTRCAS